jgi:hypothetical protein
MDAVWAIFIRADCEPFAPGASRAAAGDPTAARKMEQGESNQPYGFFIT